MTNPILLKRSATPAKVPLVGDLALGELALNTNDGKLFFKKNDGVDAIVTIGDTADKWTTPRNLSLSGDGTATLTGVDGSGNVSAAFTLANVNANVGSFGSASQVTTFTVNSKGQITAAAAVAIAIGAAAVSSGTFADARIAQSNVTQHQAALSIAESQIADGTLLARLAANETVGGAWSFTNTINFNGAVNFNGATTTINSTVTTLDDPIITLGGDTAPTTNDAKDRGVEYRWHNGTVAKLGFFGLDASTGKWTFIPDAVNTGEVFTGTKGTMDAYVEAANITGTLDVPNGGTGLTTASVGGLVLGNGTGNMSVLAAAAANNVLLSNGAGANPIYGKVGLNTHTSGVLDVNKGGTGAATLTGYVKGNGTGAMSASATIPTSDLTGTIDGGTY